MSAHHTGNHDGSSLRELVIRWSGALPASHSELERFVRSVSRHLDDEEATALTTEPLALAVAGLFDALCHARESDQCIVEICHGVEVIRAHCGVDTAVELERGIVDRERPLTSIVVVSWDVPWLVDTFTGVVRDLVDDARIFHPIVEASELRDVNAAFVGGTRLVSFFTATTPSNLPRTTLEQLARTLAAKARELMILERDREAMVEDLVSHAHAASGLDSAETPGTSAIDHFLPIAERIVRDDEEQRRGIPVDVALLAPPREGWLLEPTPVLSPVLDHTPLRALSFDTAGGTAQFVGVFQPSLVSGVGISAPEIATRLERVRTLLSLLPTSHSWRTLRDFVASLPLDLAIGAPDETFDELCRLGLLVEELGLPRALVVPVTLGARLVVVVPAARVEYGLEERVASVLRDYGVTIVSELGRNLTARRLVLDYLLDRGPAQAELLEEAIAAATTPFRLRIEAAVRRRGAPDDIVSLAVQVAEGMEESYRIDTADEQVVQDVLALARARHRSGRLAVLASRSQPPESLRLIAVGSRPALSDVVPVLEGFGARVTEEVPYTGRIASEPVWMIELRVVWPSAAGNPDPAATHGTTLAEAIESVLAGDAEADQLNSLIPQAGLSLEDVDLLRALSGYVRFGSLGVTETSVRATLTRSPAIARDLVELVRARFDPDLPEERRQTALHDVRERLAVDLQGAPTLEDEKVLRALLELVDAMTRTNLFQAHREAIAFKLDPRRVSYLPEPRPRFEIYLRSRTTEAVHLRAGRIARGGIRFSDRPDDFRVEILGLMKAQTVKNAVIVPMGSKGGFVVRDLVPGERDPAKVERSYSTFMRTLLSLTDNLVEGRIVHPERTVIADADDHYLVVAADKGTATFSDIANAIAEEQGFWLGDAFASGGSHGFDHKAMGITAKGTWISVRHHLDELGRDPDGPITVVGIGDMSGDVFGNGMLRSHGIRLVGAFDHRHIFLDPDPDPERSFAARASLFARGAGTSWADYPTEAISHGGGVFSRHAKHVEVSPEVAALLELEPGPYEPDAVIRALLRAPVDVIFNGGIGTYVRASWERDTDVGDHANDHVRITGAEVRARIIAEGGNLGLTQAGRIEFCLHGGRVNTDSIDNSAGVDTSDHEVNIKIALDALVAAGQLSRDERNTPPAPLAGEVEAQVLADNVYQNWVLSLEEREAARRGEEHGALLARLVEEAELDVAVEALPDPGALGRGDLGRSLTRSELSIELSYAKIHLTQLLEESHLLDHPITDDTFLDYFPIEVRRLLERAAIHHPLRREIVATALANLLVNHLGILGVGRVAALGRTSYRRAAELATIMLIATNATEVCRRLLWRRDGPFATRLDAYARVRDVLVEGALALRLLVEDPRSLLDPTTLAQRADALEGIDLGDRLSAEVESLEAQGIEHRVARLAAWRLAPWALAAHVAGVVDPTQATAMLTHEWALDLVQQSASITPANLTEATAVQEVKDRIMLAALRELREGTRGVTDGELDALANALARSDVLLALLLATSFGTHA